MRNKRLGLETARERVGKELASIDGKNWKNGKKKELETRPQEFVAELEVAKSERVRGASATPSWTGLAVRKADSAVMVDRRANINQHGVGSSNPRRKKCQKTQMQGLAKDSAGKTKPT